MELEQIVKRLEWLDEERRKDKMTIASLEDRLERISQNMPGLIQQMTEMSSQLTRVTTMLTRFDQIENAMTQARVEFARTIENIEKQRADRDREVEKVRRADLESLNKAIADNRHGLEALPEIKKALQTRVEEEYRLGKLISELEQSFLASHRFEEDFRRSQKLIDESVRQDGKRLNDQQAEVTAFRKRLDEQRAKTDLAVDTVRKLEQRLVEMAATEGERRQEQNAYVDRLNMVQVERDRTWKEWQVKFDEILKSATDLGTQLQSLETLQRSVKRSQEGLDEVSQRFERRINEITEMERLGDERFRQEWVAFKADDQKRWVNYTLAQEEQNREIYRQMEKSNTSLTILDDLAQELKVQLQLVTESSQKRLQGLLTLSHEWLEDHDRTYSPGKLQS